MAEAEARAQKEEMMTQDDCVSAEKNEYFGRIHH